MATRAVYLWDANQRLTECRERGRDFVTEIVNEGFVPPAGSVLIGLTSDMNSEMSIEALGVVKSINRVTQGRRGLRVEPIILFDSIPFADLLGNLEPKIVGRINRAGLPRELRPSRLPPTAATSVIQALSAVDGIREWLNEIDVRIPVTEERLQEFHESHDAIATALEIANLRGFSSTVFSRPSINAVPEDVIASLVKNAHLADSEEDLIPEDLRRFEAQTRSSLVAGHVARFRGRDYELTVFNVNKKPLEVSLGVDLVYWDTVNNIFTLVQYKRLDREQQNDKPGDWAYKAESEIRRQLSLMVTPKGTLKSSGDWRMTSPYWFKFVRRDAARFRDTKLLKGFYVPAEYLRLAVDDGTLKTGPRNGFEITYDNVKRITRSTFSELIRRGLIGTRSAQSADLMKIITDLGSSGRSAIVAMKSRWVEQEDAGALDDLDEIFERTVGRTGVAPTLSMNDLLPDLDETV